MSILTVKPINLKKGKGRPPLGHELFPQLAANIYISAGTKSGKTTLISHILDHCAGKKTKVFIFCPTVYIDKTYKHITEQLTKRKIDHNIYQHFIDENGINILDGIINELIKQSEPKPQTDERKIKSHKIVNGEIVREYYEQEKKRHSVGNNTYGDPTSHSETRAQKEKDSSKDPQYFFIFDDLSSDMRHKSIYKLLAKQRHFKSKTIISTQSINNLMPNSIGQLDYILVFGGQREEAIEGLRRKLDLPIGEDDFNRLYHEATNEKYHFLYIDRREVEFKKDFEIKL